MIKKLLVAIDGSQPAVKVLDFALDIAEKYASDVQIVSVVPPADSVIPKVTPATPPTEFYNIFINEVEKRLKSVLSEAFENAKKKNPALKVSTRLLTGRPAEKIVQTAKDENFDMIVIGSRGLGGVEEIILGSVSDRVADTATCPVLIVKYKYRIEIQNAEKKGEG